MGTESRLVHSFENGNLGRPALPTAFWRGVPREMARGKLGFGFRLPPPGGSPGGAGGGKEEGGEPLTRFLSPGPRWIPSPGGEGGKGASRDVTSPGGSPPAGGGSLGL